MIGVKYGDYSLQQAGKVWATETDVYGTPENVVQADELAEADGAIIVSQRFKSKAFTVSGVLRTDTIAGTDMLIDEFKRALMRKNMNFDIDYGDSIRRYLATPRNLMIARPRGMRTARWDVEFLSPDGMGWDLTSQPLLEPTGVAVSNARFGVMVDGSYKAEPLITLTVNTISGGTNKTISIGNAQTLRSMRISRSWSAGDKLEIDNLRKTVFVNDVAHDFRGQFIEFEPGANSITYIDDFDARDITATASYTRRWL